MLKTIDLSEKFLQNLKADVIIKNIKDARLSHQKKKKKCAKEKDTNMSRINSLNVESMSNFYTHLPPF